MGNLGSTFSDAPQPNLILSRDQRVARGVSHSDYVDAYNQAEMAKYNNEYNYWLWQQQANYNDPVQQVARLKAAGLNPNYNRIDGTGNLGSIPASSGTISPSIAQNRLKRISTAFDAALSVARSLGAGVSAMREYSNLPPMSKLSSFKDLVMSFQRSRTSGEVARAMNDWIGEITNEELAGQSPTLLDSGYAAFSRLGDAERPNELVRSQTLKNESTEQNILRTIQQTKSEQSRAALLHWQEQAAKYDLYNLKPKQASKLQAEADLTMSKLGISEKERKSYWLRFGVNQGLRYFGIAVTRKIGILKALNH